MIDTTREAVERLAAQIKRNGEKLTAVTLPFTGALFDLAADTLLALLARAEAAERESEVARGVCRNATQAANDTMALLPAQIAAAVEAEQKAICALLEKRAADHGARLRDARDEDKARAGYMARAKRKTLHRAIEAIRARGPSSTLADALRQAEAAPADTLGHPSRP